LFIQSIPFTVASKLSFYTATETITDYPVAETYEQMHYTVSQKMHQV